MKQTFSIYWNPGQTYSIWRTVTRCQSNFHNTTAKLLEEALDKIRRAFHAKAMFFNSYLKIPFVKDAAGKAGPIFLRVRCLGAVRQNEILKLELRLKKAGQYHVFFRVKKIPMIAPIRITGATLTNSHSNA